MALEPHPQLLLGEAYRGLAGAEEDPPPQRIGEYKFSNCVLHISDETSPGQELLRGCLYGRVDPKQPATRALRVLSCDVSSGRNGHVRFATDCHTKGVPPTSWEEVLHAEGEGKSLFFETGPAIRAGPYTPAGAVGQFIKVMTFQSKRLGRKATLWGAFTTPNIVMSGVIEDRLEPASLRQRPDVTWSAKFPGDSLQTPFGVTLELFLERASAGGASGKRRKAGKARRANTTPFISPGIKTAGSIAKAVRLVNEVAAAHGASGAPGI